MLALAATLAALAPAQAPALPERILAGRSVQGRPIVAVRRGPASAPVRVLVTGSTHGTELAGHAVIARLRRMRPPAGVQLWLVRTLNPDGAVRGTRQNARGVDLNRNFPRRWRGGGRAFDTYFPGPRAASEPEARALMRLVRRVRPDVSLHYHQALRLVNLSVGADPALVRAYARRVGLPAEPLPHYRGTATSWSNHRLPGASAFVVELPGGPLAARAARRHARAVHAVAVRSARPAAGPARPAIRATPIPYGPRRERQMRDYARRHYGIDTVRLREPKAIIEHVGVSDADVMGRRRQLRASLALTRWLQARHGIGDSDVIGHAESLSSPYHHERVARLRNRKHDDFSRATMRRYRRLL